MTITDDSERDNKKSKLSPDAEPEFEKFDNPWNIGILPFVPYTRR